MVTTNLSRNDEELHIILLWEKARIHEKIIIEDIASSNCLRILECHEIKWSEKYVPSNLTRFYGTALPSQSSKEKECGTGKFLLITVLDISPNYGLRETSRGHEYVNVNMFDLKCKYREWTGGGHKVHTTNNIKETAHDLVLLIGKNYHDYLKIDFKQWNGTFKYLEADLIGTKKWNNLSELFYVLNDTIDYAVLRNHEELPESFATGEHSDIDIIVKNITDAVLMLNAKPVFKQKSRVRYSITVGDAVVFLDLRQIGDDYYCAKWQRYLLENRVMTAKNIYTLDNESYFYTLVYHAFLHKRSIAADYYKKLETIFIKTDLPSICDGLNFKFQFDLYFWLLKQYMHQNGYAIVVPKDPSVLLNKLPIELYEAGNFLKEEFLFDGVYPFMVRSLSNSEYAYLLAYNEGERYFIKIGGLGDSCITEYKVTQFLYSMNTDNFLCPCFYKKNSQIKAVAFRYVEGKTLSEMINCADGATAEIKKNLISQLYSIAKTLWESPYVHRDIRPENFLVAEGNRLVLIDMQFAVDVNKYREYSDVKRKPGVLRELGGSYAIRKMIWDDMHSLRDVLKFIGKCESYEKLYEEVDNFLTERIGKRKIRYKYYFKTVFGHAFRRFIAVFIPSRKLRNKIRKL